MFEFTLPEINSIDPENIIVEKEIPIEKPPLLGAKLLLFREYISTCCVPNSLFGSLKTQQTTHLHGHLHGS